MTHVLVVDDELSIRETFQAFLEDEGYQVSVAADYFEAERFLTSAAEVDAPPGVDIVVADIVLPRISGMAILQRTRQLDENIPVIMITGEPHITTAAESVRAGAYDYLVKPVTQKMLIQAVGRAAERKRLLDEKRRLEAENRLYQADLERRVAERTAELERSNRGLATLIEVGHAVSETLELMEVLKRVTQRAAQVCGAQRCTIWLLAEDGERLLPLMSQFSNGHADYDMWTTFQRTDYSGAPQIPEIARLLRERRPVFAPDRTASPKLQEWSAIFHAHNALFVPLISKDQVIGIMALDQGGSEVSSGQEFTDDQVDLAAAIAAQAAIAIENARLFEAEQRRRQEAETLYRAAQVLATSLDLRYVFERILSELRQVVPYDSASVQLLRGEQLEIIGGHGFPNLDELLGLTFDLRADDNPNCQVIRRRASFIVDDAPARYPAFRQEPHAAAGIRSWLGTPLLLGDRLIGMLALDKREPNFYTPAHARLVEAFAIQAAIAIENSRLFEAVRRQAGELLILHNAALSVSSSLEPRDVLRALAEQIGQALNVTSVRIYEWNPPSPAPSALAEWIGPGAIATERKSQIGAVYRDEPACAGPRACALQAMREKKPAMARLSDLQPGSPDHQEALKSGWQSLLIIPLIVHDRVLGYAELRESHWERRFTASEVQLCQTLMAEAAVALENADLYNTARRSATEMTMLYHTALEMGNYTRLPELLWTICDRAAHLLNIDKGGLYLYDEARRELELVVSYKMSRDYTGVRIPLGAGVAGRVVQTGQSLIVNDYRTWDGQVAIYSDEQFETVIGVPLKWQERVIGALSLSGGRSGRIFTADDERLLNLFAQQAALAIENSRLYTEAQRHVEELTILHNIDVAITSTLNLEDVLQTIFQQVRAALSPTTFYVGLYKPEKDELYIPLLVDRDETRPPVSLKVGPGPIGEAIRTRATVRLDDATAELAEGYPMCSPCRSAIICPLIVKEQVIGVIAAQSDQPHAFDAQQAHLFSGIAVQVAIAVQNARLFEEINRRLKETRLLQEITQAVAATFDFDEVLTCTIETLRRALKLEWIAFLVPDAACDGLIVHGPASSSSPLDPGLAWRAYQSGETQLITDARPAEDGPSRGKYPYPPFLSAVALPVKVGERVVAVLDVRSERAGAFDEDELRLFSAIAAQLGVALDNARLYKETQRRLSDARLIQEVMLASSSTLDFDLVLERTVKAISRAARIERLGFLMPDEPDSVLVAYPPADDAFQVPISGSPAGQAYHTGQAVLAQGATGRGSYPHHTPDVLSTLAVPVRAGDHIIAVLQAESPRECAFGEDELRLFTTIAGQLGVALENARLYQKLKAQANELSRAYKELQETIRLRTELVQNVSHELRTPLSLVQGYVDLLLDGTLGPLQENQRDALLTVRERTAGLARLIHNLTMLQNVPRIILERESVAIVPLLRRMMDDFLPAAEKARVRFSAELPTNLPPVWADPDRLELVFGHLIENAIKFSPNGGVVAVRAWASADRVHVRIADQGIGIPPDQLNRIFERFYQVDGSASRRFGGMGVGLALVWEIVEAHGGEVNVESKPGQGSAFTVTLPCHANH